MESKSILSKSERVNVFAMYYGQRVLKFSKTAPATQVMDYYMMGRLTDDCVLALTPLEDISDEDAIEAGKIMGATDEDIESVRIEVGGIKILFEPFYNIDYKIADNDVKPILVFFAYQYLIQQGYDVPLFFGVNHWANGKTAIELSIAISKNNT